MAEWSKAPRSGRGPLCGRGFESHFLHSIFTFQKTKCISSYTQAYMSQGLYVLLVRFLHGSLDL